MPIAIAGITSPLKLISVLLIVVILSSGGAAAINVANNSAYGGLFERITIFAFMLWVIVFSYLIIKIQKQ